MTNHQHRIESLTLVTGGQGVFDVEVDGEMIWSKSTTGRKPEPGEVLASFEDRLDPGLTRRS